VRDRSPFVPLDSEFMEDYKFWKYMFDDVPKSHSVSVWKSESDPSRSLIVADKQQIALEFTSLADACAFLVKLGTPATPRKFKERIHKEILKHGKPLPKEQP